MIENERTAKFIESFNGDNCDFLNNLEREAIANKVPIIRKSAENLLKLMISIKKPLNILEIGAAVGYSAILMAEVSLPEAKITTIENYDKRIPVLKENIIKSGHSNKISLIEGDALLILKDLVKAGKKYDFVFMDAAKAQYINMLPDTMELLLKDGILISDNVLMDDEIMASRYAISRRDRTIHKRMREYLYAITHSEKLNTQIFPMGDGITVSVKLED